MTRTIGYLLFKGHDEKQQKINCQTSEHKIHRMFQQQYHFPSQENRTNALQLIHIYSEKDE